MTETESVQVVVRCRPLNAKETTDNRQPVVQVLEEACQIRVHNPRHDAQGDVKTFTFDAVFGPDSSQDHVFEVVARPIIDSAMSGYNGTIFAYGQTGTGKTFTMEGQPSSQTRGIIPRAFQHIFDYIHDAASTRYLVRASFLEIYNESIRDLLAPGAGNKNIERKGLDLRENRDGNVYVAELRTEVVDSVEAMSLLLKKGNTYRSTGATLMNQDSSRSHSIFTVTVECTGNLTQDHVRVGKLNLVDLAGSERQSKTGTTGDRLMEAKKINLSLSALGNVISALVDGKSGGNTKTVMMANIGPADWNFDETLSTLRYANRAKNIKNRPCINEDPKDALLREYQEEIARLKAALTNHVAPINAAPTLSDVDIEQLRIEIAQQIKTAQVATGHKMSAQQCVEVEAEALRQAEERQAALRRESELAAAEAERIRQEAEARAGDVEQKQAEAERLKQERQEMLKKLELYESKILHSDSHDPVQSLIIKAKDREEQIKRKQMELEERRAAEAAMEQQLAEKDEAALMKEQQYATLESEVKDTKRKLKKLLAKHKEISQEVEDMYSEWHQEKEQYIDQMRLLHQQLQLKELVIDLFVPIEEVQKVVSQARWDQEKDAWIRETVRPIKDDKYLKRPVSAAGLRRPTSEFTKSAHAMGDLNPRFRSDNILTLDLDLPERTTFDYDPYSGTQEAQQALNLAFADDDGVIVIKGLDDVGDPDARTPRSQGLGLTEHRPQSSRQRPSSARRRSSRTH